MKNKILYEVTILFLMLTIGFWILAVKNREIPSDKYEKIKALNIGNYEKDGRNYNLYKFTYNGVRYEISESLLDNSISNKGSWDKIYINKDNPAESGINFITKEYTIYKGITIISLIGCIISFGYALYKNKHS